MRRPKGYVADSPATCHGRVYSWSGNLGQTEEPFRDSSSRLSSRRGREDVMQSSIDARFECLRSIPYFAGLANEPLDELARSWSERRCRAHSIVFLKGDRSEGLYFVVSGRVATFTSSSDGPQQ